MALSEPASSDDERDVFAIALTGGVDAVLREMARVHRSKIEVSICSQSIRAIVRRPYSHSSTYGAAVVAFDARVQVRARGREGVDCHAAWLPWRPVGALVALWSLQSMCPSSSEGCGQWSTRVPSEVTVAGVAYRAVGAALEPGRLGRYPARRVPRGVSLGRGQSPATGWESGVARPVEEARFWKAQAPAERCLKVHCTTRAELEAFNTACRVFLWDRAKKFVNLLRG